MFSKLASWFSHAFESPPSPLLYMRLGPEGRDDNPLMIQFFTWDCLHNSLSWWKHFETEVPRLAELGITQVWLPPPNKAAEPKGRGYDAYDLWDLGEFVHKGTVATRWGTREELLHACKVANEHGIDILIDAVLNHKLGADHTETFRAVPVQESNRLRNAGPPRQIQGWTSFDYPGRGDKYSTLHWHHEHFTGVDWDQTTRTKGIYRIAEPGRRGWSRNVDPELGNYDFLLGVDIDHRHPEVQEDLLSWGKWVLQTTGATGFRLDAIKHIDRKFTLKWIQETRAAAGDKSMFVVSEYWSGNLKLILPYIKAFKGETTFFDVPLHMNFNQASRERTRYDLRKILNNTIVQVKPNDAVTFVDNHDTASLFPAVEGKSLESWVGDNFKIQAYAIILLRGYGYPCVFYGDLYPNKECYSENIARNITLLIEARRHFAYGATDDYLAHPNYIGFVRRGDATHSGCAVILSNKEDDSGGHIHELRMNVGVENAGKTYASHMTKHGRVEIDAAGWGTFSCFANNVQVWTPLEQAD
ncbi:glycoside hydrolase family 13 protein [Hypholoma sublateritium FD-334 SS-4]|uniref:Glycoside hydrolase family 13 protein n=1 Tax=Hypholoma sublateritium (strain FD-334 SS-4) TaxID=945553 RepID=A0A0D2MQN5_HYPSF|nr:glycoside hydrolase family 13 protein [Hypholoma sublateritium FD-334 SS-4]